MKKPSKTEAIIAGLQAQGCVELPSSSGKYRKWSRGRRGGEGFYWTGPSGALRAGRMASDTFALMDHQVSPIVVQGIQKILGCNLETAMRLEGYSPQQIADTLGRIEKRREDTDRLRAELRERREAIGSWENEGGRVPAMAGS